MISKFTHFLELLTNWLNQRLMPNYVHLFKRLQYETDGSIYKNGFSQYSFVFHTPRWNIIMNEMATGGEAKIYYTQFRVAVDKGAYTSLSFSLKPKGLFSKIEKALCSEIHLTGHQLIDDHFTFTSVIPKIASTFLEDPQLQTLLVKSDLDHFEVYHYTSDIQVEDPDKSIILEFRFKTPIDNIATVLSSFEIINLIVDRLYETKEIDLMGSKITGKKFNPSEI